MSQTDLHLTILTKFFLPQICSILVQQIYSEFMVENNNPYNFKVIWNFYIGKHKHQLSSTQQYLLNLFTVHPIKCTGTSLLFSTCLFVNNFFFNSLLFHEREVVLNCFSLQYIIKITCEYLIKIAFKRTTPLSTEMTQKGNWGDTEINQVAAFFSLKQLSVDL